MKLKIGFFSTCIIFIFTSLLLAEGQAAADDLRNQLKDEGIEFGLGLTNIYQRNVKGGQSTKSRKGEFSGSYDIEVAIDLEKLLGFKGELFIHGEGGWTGSGGIDTSSVGSFSGVNADAIGNRSFDIVEFFYTTPFTDRLSLTVGKIDFSGFFDSSSFANDEASQFLNGSLVNNPSIPFPDYSLGIILSYDLTDNWYVMGGVADAQADGRETGFNTAFHNEDHFLYIVETGISTALSSTNGHLDGTYRFGIWGDPQPKAHSDSIKQYRDDIGFYTSFDQMIYKENKDPEDHQGAGIFFRYGYADNKKNDLNHFYSFGVQYQGLFDSRDNDILGLGYSNCSFSNYADTTYPNDHEKVFEAYYSIEISPSIRLTPDIQYIANTGGTNIRDAFLVGVRLQLDF